MRRPHDNEAAWLATLAGGLVALLAVAALLERLRRAVMRVEEAVDGVWSAGKRVAQNTQAAHLVGTTRTRSAELRRQLEPERKSTMRRP